VPADNQNRGPAAERQKPLVAQIPRSLGESHARDPEFRRQFAEGRKLWATGLGNTLPELIPNSFYRAHPRSPGTTAMSLLSNLLIYSNKAVEIWRIVLSLPFH
jgi:hypothetical protein